MTNFKQYFAITWRQTWKLKLLTFVLPFVIMTLYMVVLSYMYYGEKISEVLYYNDFDSGIPFYNGLTIATTFIAAVVFLALTASATFSAYATKQGRLTTLCLPVSNGAKYLVYIINGVIYPIIAFIVSVILAITLSLLILQLIFTIKFDGAIDFLSLVNFSDMPDITYTNIILFIVLVQAFFMAGSIFYPSKSFIKTLGLAAGLIFGSVSLASLIFIYYYDKGYTLSTDSIELWYQCVIPILVVGFYTVSYFRMKSTQSVLRW